MVNVISRGEWNKPGQPAANTGRQRVGILAGRPRWRHGLVPEKPVMRRRVAIYGLGLLTAVMATSAHAAIVVDGNVLDSEGYTSDFAVVVDIEKGPTGVLGGRLFLHETEFSIFVGFVAELTLNDNTYGANKASDWGSKDHFLVGKGGKSLEGSDKWEVTIPIIGGDDLFLKLDYIDETNGIFAAKIESAKQGTVDIDQSGITFATSLENNFINFPAFFDTDKDNPIASPGPAPAPFPLITDPVLYDFDSPAELWLAAIMYEFKVDKSVINSEIDFPGLIGSEGIFHMSPNKLGGNKVFYEVVPLPAALPLFLSALAGLGFVGWRRRQADA